MKGYCSGCKQIKEMVSPTRTKLKNNDIVFIGKCGTCNTEIYKKEKQS